MFIVKQIIKYFKRYYIFAMQLATNFRSNKKSEISIWVVSDKVANCLSSSNPTSGFTTFYSETRFFIRALTLLYGALISYKKSENQAERSKIKQMNENDYDGPY